MSIEALMSVTYGDRPRGTKHIGWGDVLRVLLVLAEHSGPDGAGACPAQSTIAEVLELPRRLVREAIAALVEQGRIFKTADAIPRQRGDTYTVVCSSNDELGQALPAIVDDELGQAQHPNTRAIRAGDSGRQLGQATRAGSACHEPEPEPENPPTPLSLEEFTAAVLTDEDLMMISNERTRAIIAEMTGRRNGDNVHELAEPYEFAHLTPAVRRRKRAG